MPPPLLFFFLPPPGQVGRLGRWTEGPKYHGQSPSDVITDVMTGVGDLIEGRPEQNAPLMFRHLPSKHDICGLGETAKTKYYAGTNLPEVTV